MATYQEERERFVEVWVRNGGRYPDARTIMSLAKTIDNAATQDCNGILPGRLAVRSASAMKTIMGLCEEGGFSVRFGGDPRGYTTKITFPDGAYNTMGGREDGWGVPTR